MSDLTEQIETSVSPDQSEQDPSDKPMTNREFNLVFHKYQKKAEAKIAELEKRLAPAKEKESKPESSEVNSAYEDRFKALEAKHQKARAQSKANAVKSELMSRNVKPELLDYVADFHAKYIDFEDDDSDNLIYRDPTNGDLSLSQAFDALTKSEKGKHLLCAPKSIVGSGDSSKQSPTNSASRDQEIERQKKFFLNR